MRLASDANAKRKQVIGGCEIGHYGDSESGIPARRACEQTSHTCRSRKEAKVEKPGLPALGWRGNPAFQGLMRCADPWSTSVSFRGRAHLSLSLSPCCQP